MRFAFKFVLVFVTGLLVFLVSTLPLAYALTGVVDQKQEDLSGGSISIFFQSPIGQQFIPSLSPLIGVDVWVRGIAFDSDTLTVNIRESAISGNLLSTTSKLVSSPFQGWVHFDLPSEVQVTIGSTYVIQLVVTENIFFWQSSGGGSYPLGNAIIGGTEEIGVDFAFRTYAPGSASPPNPHHYVGGELFSADKLAVLSPYLALMGLAGVVASTAVVMKRRRRK